MTNSTRNIVISPPSPLKSCCHHSADLLTHSPSQVLSPQCFPWPAFFQGSPFNLLSAQTRGQQGCDKQMGMPVRLRRWKKHNITHSQWCWQLSAWLQVGLIWVNSNSAKKASLISFPVFLGSISWHSYTRTCASTAQNQELRGRKVGQLFKMAYAICLPKH